MLTTTVLITVCFSCASQKITLNSDADINFETAHISLSNGDKYILRKSNLSQVKQCIALNPNLDCYEIERDGIENPTFEARKMTQRAYLLPELIDQRGYVKIHFKIGIDSSGNVLIANIEKYTGNVSEKLVNKLAKNLLNMKYESDTNANCLAIGRYTIAINTKF